MKITYLGTYGATALTPAYLPALAARTVRVTRKRASPKRAVSKRAVAARLARRNAARLARAGTYTAPRGLKPAALGVTVTGTNGRFSVTTATGRTFKGLTATAVTTYLRAVKRAGVA